jgi:hypothetical protein
MKDFGQQENGIEIINHRYVRILFENDFKRQIKWLQDNLQQHRSSNFMGSLLQHHTMKSTKYMSMWIEEKIRNKTLSILDIVQV